MATNISRIKINATIGKVCDTLTKPELVKLWQFGSDLQTTWKINSDIKFVTVWEGTIFKQWGKVIEIQQNKLIKYSLFATRPDLEDNPENYFIMSYILTDENGEITLEIIQEDNRPNAI